MGCRTPAAELAMLRTREHVAARWSSVRPVVTGAGCASMILTVRSRVRRALPIEQYAVAIAAGDARRPRAAARRQPAGDAPARAGREGARGASTGRDFVLPDDVDALAVPVLAHPPDPDPACGRDRCSSAAGAAGRGHGASRSSPQTPVPAERGPLELQARGLWSGG